MAATTIERNTDSLLSSGVPPFHNFGVDAATKILYGTIVFANGYGNLVEGFTAASGYTTVGVALATADNLTGAAGDKRCDVGFGVYYFNNSGGGDAISNAEIGSLCYVVDNQTVAKTDGTGTRTKAGVVWDISPTGQVGVQFSNIAQLL